VRARLTLPDAGLTDGVVALRRWRADDEDWVYATCSRERDISQWTRVPWPYRRAHAREFLGRAFQQWEAGTDATFVIVDAADAARLGAIGVHRIDGDPEGAEPPDEVGYWLAAAARGRGVATRALRVVSDWAFSVVGRPALVLQVIRGNDASVRVAERAGFRPVPAVERCGDRLGDDLLAFRRDAEPVRP
jgi:RimJ/RimL family protein N-acetyltransferase